MTIEKKADRDNSDNAETIVNKLEARELMLRFLTHGDMDGEQAETLINAMEACLTNLGYDPKIVGPKLEEYLNLKFFENRKIENLGEVEMHNGKYCHCLST